VDPLVGRQVGGISEGLFACPAGEILHRCEEVDETLDVLTEKRPCNTVSIDTAFHHYGFFCGSLEWNCE
jgi:hypothetical protein